MSKEVVIIGYSGHAFVVCDIFLSQHMNLLGYFEDKEKQYDPYCLQFLGREDELSSLNVLSEKSYFTAIGDNITRKRINNFIEKKTSKKPINAIHQNSTISSRSTLGQGIMVGIGCTINPCTIIGDGVICNTQSVIEHECYLGDYCHIAPGAVLCGNVVVGKNTFIGARSVVIQGVTIGDDVVVGAGSVIIKDIPNNSKVIGNPQKYI